MENPSKKSKTQATHCQGDEPAAAAHVHLPDDIITEILTRLPGKSVLRFRAVSRSWHRITTDPAFLAAHARRRPLEVILRTLVKSVRPRDDWVRYNTDDIALATVPVSGDAVGPGPSPARRLVQYPYSINGTAPASSQGMVIDSCDGVLLFKIARCTYVIFNPVTRQWAELPRFPENDRRSHSPPWTSEFGFYRHQQSGELRLMCRYSFHTRATIAREYYVLSTAATEPRIVISMADGADDDATSIVPFYMWVNKGPPVAVHGRLYWLFPRRRHRHGSRAHHLVALDTELEKFHVMKPPPRFNGRVNILAMDGQLVSADLGNQRMDLRFFVETGHGDFTGGRWKLRHRVDTALIYAQLPDPATGSCVRKKAIAGTDEGDIVVEVEETGGLLMYNRKTKTSRFIEVGKSRAARLSPIMFRQSLVQHQCFKAWSPDALPWMKFFS